MILMFIKKISTSGNSAISNRSKSSPRIRLALIVHIVWLKNCLVLNKYFDFQALSIAQIFFSKFWIIHWICSPLGLHSDLKWNRVWLSSPSLLYTISSRSLLMSVYRNMFIIKYHFAQILHVFFASLQESEYVHENRTHRLIMVMHHIIFGG